MGAETWLAIGKFIGAVIGIGSAGTGWYYFAVQVARLALLAYAAKEFAPKPDLSRAAQQKLVTVRDTIHPQRFVYGTDMVSGPIFFAQVHGADNEFLTTGVELVGHEVDSYLSFRLDDTNIDIADISGGVVQTGRFANVASVRYALGLQAQNSGLHTDFPSLFGVGTHNGRGHAYMSWKFELVKDNQAFETGAPQNLRAEIKGKKVYDPRLDDTNGGTGPHRLSDSSTWEWSDNPALCLADFMIDTKFGMQEDSARIDWPMIITAANICEETVTVPSGTQPRYTCNATFESTERRGDVRDALLNAMLGRMVFSAGKWRIWAGAAITPDVTIDETYMAGPISVQATAGSKERYNRVRGKFIDPSRNYTASTYPEIRDATYESEDGGEIRPLIADFMATHDDYEAQRKGIITLKQSRQQRVVSFVGNMKCFPLQPGTTVLLTIDEFNFSADKFFITEWKLSDKGVELLMIEENDLAWADPAVGNYATRSPTGTIVWGQLATPPPTGVTVTSQIGGILLEWTSSSFQTVVATEVWASDDNNRANAKLVATVQGEEYLDQVSDGRFRYYWLRNVSSVGVPSVFEPDLATTTYTTAPILGSTPVSVPDFSPGAIGGQADLRFAINQVAGGGANDGEIRVTGSEFVHPDGTSIATSADFSILTFYEGATVGRFYIMFSATAAETRFGGVAGDWGGGSPDDTRFVCVTHDSVNGWRARNDSGAYFALTPVSSDSIIAVCDKTAASGGINVYIPLLSGLGGTAGNSGIVVQCYQRASSTPATPSGGSYNFDTQTLTPPSGWFNDPPAPNGDALYITTAIAEATGTGGTDSSLTWSTPSILAVDGETGLSVYFAQAFRRNASQPATPTGGSYNFDTQTLTPPTNWSDTPPASDGNPLWVSTSIAEIVGTTGTDNTLTWTTPDNLVSDGADGATGTSGNSVYFCQIFRRNASQPATPSGGSYNFDTQTLTPPSLWDDEPPATNGNPLWTCVAVAEVAGTSGTDSTLTWSTPRELVSDGTDGDDGTAGDSVHVSTVYRRSASAPATPTGGSYNFGTKTLTPPTNWSESVPAADGNKLYASTATWSVNGTTGTDSSTTWSTPVEILTDAQYRDIIFRRDNAVPSTPTGDNPTGWFDSIPAGVAPVWQSVGTKNSQDQIVGVWSTPQRIEGLQYRGAYSGTTAYIQFDVVTYQERTYVLTVASSTGNAPSGTNSQNAYWDLIAAKGDPGDPATAYNETITISGPGPVNLRDAANNHTPAYDGASDATITFNFNSGTITGNAGAANSGNGGHGIDTGSWPSGTYTIDLTLNVNNGATVRGGGGGGGRGGTGGYGNGQDGGDGGDAIFCQEDIDIVVNSGGLVEAPGGGGGGGAGGNSGGSEPLDYVGGGGGGADPNGIGGDIGTSGNTVGATAGGTGTTTSGGSGGSGASTYGGDGGDGGNHNTNGLSGQNGANGGGTGGSGGSRGYAVRYNANTVTVTGAGTVTGQTG